MKKPSFGDDMAFGRAVRYSSGKGERTRYTPKDGKSTAPPKDIYLRSPSPKHTSKELPQTNRKPKKKRNRKVQRFCKKVGQTIPGKVKNITNFGAFVNLGSVDGLIHISEISWRRINHPSEIVSVGQKVEVRVIKVDPENERISLSLKQTTLGPWKNVEKRYPVGSTVNAVIVNVVNYGAFAQLEEGIVGLIHISKMSADSMEASPANIVNTGDKIKVRVIEISKKHKRISLSMT